MSYCVFPPTATLLKNQNKAVNGRAEPDSNHGVTLLQMYTNRGAAWDGLD